MINQNIIWIGIQESEIAQTATLFSGSITIFGTNKNGNYAFDKEYNLRYNYNIDNDLWIDFVNQSARKIIQHYPNCLFILYYPMDVTYYDHIVTERIICSNDIHELDLWDNKFRCRDWIGNDIPTIKNKVCYAEKIKENIPDKLLDGQKFVVQGEYSCGGSKTWLLTKDNLYDVFAKLESKKKYSISPYIKNNISVNIHLIIYQNEVLLFPPSIQLISINSLYFNYQGADFITYHHLPKKIRNKVQHYSSIIGERLRRSGYRGVCGIDYIITQSEVFFLEINPRFQSSSFLLNFALQDVGQNISIQHLHMDAFTHAKCQFSIPLLKVNYSFYKYFYSYDNETALKYFEKNAKAFDEVLYISDNLSWNSELEDGTYLYKLVFKRNISAISHDFNLIIHPNLLIDKCIAEFQNLESQMLELKIMLLSHGITMSLDTIEYLEQTNGINYEEFSALDLTINNKYYINVPYKTNLTQLSPFQVKIKNNTTWLFYYDTKLALANIRGIDTLASKISRSGIKYSDFTYLGQDRLRIFHRLGCFFKQKECGCGFCDLENDNRKLTFETIKEAINAYENSPNIHHYLIGGGTQYPQDDFKSICTIAEYLKNKDSKSIYLMSLPPANKRTLNKLKQAGITEVSFNIEIFDRKIAKSYMPGKGEIPIQVYFDALKYAVKLWGKNGSVRTIFIVGLESKDSLLKGIEKVCKIGVSPILSLFKPIENTRLSHLLPMPDDEILDIVIRTEQLCKQYGVTLGPSCIYCEDNTLKITL